jgi:hypothetical protein
MKYCSLVNSYKRADGFVSLRLCRTDLAKTESVRKEFSPYTKYHNSNNNKFCNIFTIESSSTKGGRSGIRSYEM